MRPWIPDRLTKTEILRLLKQDRLWPLPLEEDQEELLKKGEGRVTLCNDPRLDVRIRNNLEKS